MLYELYTIRIKTKLFHAGFHLKIFHAGIYLKIFHAGFHLKIKGKVGMIFPLFFTSSLSVKHFLQNISTKYMNKSLNVCFYPDLPLKLDIKTFWGMFFKYLLEPVQAFIFLLRHVYSLSLVLQFITRSQIRSLS